MPARPWNLELSFRLHQRPRIRLGRGPAWHVQLGGTETRRADPQSKLEIDRRWKG